MERMIHSISKVKKKSSLIFSYNVVAQSDKLDHIFPCPNGKATCLGRSDGLSFLPWDTVSSKRFDYIYLTIIPRARVGYEMIDSQRGA